MRAIIGTGLALAAAYGIHVYGAGHIDGLLAAFLIALSGWAAGWLTGGAGFRHAAVSSAPPCPDAEELIVELLKSPDTGAETAQAGEKFLSALLRQSREGNGRGAAGSGAGNETGIQS